MDVDQSFRAPANGALHAGGSSWAFTRRADKINGKDNDANSLQVDLYMKQGHQTDLPEAMELKRRTMIDNGNILSYFVADAFFCYPSTFDLIGGST
jgi:plant G-box-binding factor